VLRERISEPLGMTDTGFTVGQVDSITPESAAAAAEVDALLRARHVLRDAPTAQREAMAKLVDA
jgi:CubicO group peptidase (beta-lactamase class C family)